MKFLRLIALVPVCWSLLNPALASAEREELDWDALGELRPEVDLDLDSPIPPATQDGQGNDFTTLEMRSFPELGITVPASGPGAEMFYRSMASLTGRARATVANTFAAANSTFVLPGGKTTTRQEFIKEELARAGLPPILVWIVAQESGFKDRAVSYANAWGAWQFIIRTAERFDLEIRSTTVTVRSRGKRVRTRTVQQCTGCQQLDQATKAAGEYLEEMYSGAAPEKFYQWKGWKPGMPLIRWQKDWALTMAAYNTGEHNVAKAICAPFTGKAARGLAPANICGAGAAQKDFWTIFSRLHKQTQHYVPVILAWMRIGQDPKRFGF